MRIKVILKNRLAFVDILVVLPRTNSLVPHRCVDLLLIIPQTEKRLLFKIPNSMILPNLDPAITTWLIETNPCMMGRQ